MDPDFHQRLDQLAEQVLGPEYRSYHVRGDGSCQFSSLLATLQQAVLYGAVGAHEVNGLTARSLRARVVNWLKENGDTQLEVNRSGTLRTRHDTMKNAFCWDVYLAKMGTDTPDKSGNVEWGDES